MSGYLKLPIVVVFKTSKRKNAKIQLKIIYNSNIDAIIDKNKKILDIPKTAEILQIGVGNSFISLYKNKYKL